MAASKEDERPALSDPFGSRDNDQMLSPASKDETLPGSPDSLKQDAPASSEDRSGHEWDAAKILPSQWGKRKGSVYATPASRDGHVDSSKTRDKSFHDKLKEKGWLK